MNIGSIFAVKSPSVDSGSLRLTEKNLAEHTGNKKVSRLLPVIFNDSSRSVSSKTSGSLKLTERHIKKLKGEKDFLKYTGLKFILRETYGSIKKELKEYQPHMDLIAGASLSPSSKQASDEQEVRRGSQIEVVDPKPTGPIDLEFNSVE